MSHRSLAPGDVVARRLERHALTAPPPDPTPAGVVASMHAAHAQMMSAAELSVALRLPGSTRTTVRSALWTDRTLTKTFGPRGTIHLVPTRDLAWWTGALAAVPRTRSPFTAEVRLTPDQSAQVVAAAADALRDAELTLDELDSAVVARTGRWAGDLVMPAFGGLWPRWRQAIADAGRAGVLVFGPHRGRVVTYTSPRRTDPGFSPLAPDEAVPRFLAGYLRAFGPATPPTLARWLGAPVTWAAEVLAGAEPAVERVLFDGADAWVNAGDTGVSDLGSSVRLLPYIDALSVGFQPRAEMYPGRAAERALARGQAGNYPVVLVDGVVRGVWHHRRAGRRLRVTVETWGRLGAGQIRELESQVERVGEIVEADADLTMGAVSVGPHA